MIQIPTIQAESLRFAFEEHFDEEEIYFEYVELDEIYNVLIGDDSDPHVFDMLEVSASYDDFNFGLMVFIHEYIESIKDKSIELEFYELAENCKRLNLKIDKIIKENE